MSALDKKVAKNLNKLQQQEDVWGDSRRQNSLDLALEKVLYQGEESKDAAHDQ